MRDKAGTPRLYVRTADDDPGDDAAFGGWSSRVLEPTDVIFDGARIAALRDLGVLDTDAEEDFDRYTRLVTDLLGVPVSLVSLVDADRQFFKSESGLSGALAEARQTPLSHSFCGSSPIWRPGSVPSSSCASRLPR